MQNRKIQYLLPILIGTFLVASAVLFWPTSEASAQCGSQASSCKNCHEVQAKDPVNADGTGWHQSHAFGDFCYLCHAGNNQSMVEEEAHTGMVPPLSDVKAACQSCHPDDLMERAQVYATVLGVEIGTGGGAQPATGAESSGAAVEPSSSTDQELAAPAMVVDESTVVDYNQRYDEEVLGKKPINWGNVIVGALIAVMLVGGGAFVFWNERRLGTIKFPGAAKVSVKAQDIPVVEGYSEEVTALLPLIARLNPVGLNALKRLLQNPEQANELLLSLSKLDPELVRRLRNLDRESRAMLLALSGD
jgi:hypothetical protein